MAVATSPRRIAVLTAELDEAYQAALIYEAGANSVFDLAHDQLGRGDGTGGGDALYSIESVPASLLPPNASGTFHR